MALKCSRRMWLSSPMSEPVFRIGRITVTASMARESCSSNSLQLVEQDIVQVVNARTHLLFQDETDRDQLQQPLRVPTSTLSTWKSALNCGVVWCLNQVRLGFGPPNALSYGSLPFFYDYSASVLKHAIDVTDRRRPPLTVWCLLLILEMKMTILTGHSRGWASL